MVRHILFFLHIDQITHIAAMERLSDTEVSLPATAASPTSVAMFGLLLGGLRRRAFVAATTRRVGRIRDLSRSCLSFAHLLLLHLGIFFLSIV